ncbi:MAG: RICIN domain-containing protein [Actinobacteria bacterium]|nr:RICIN domain-containing protein [Actinomycetota bacterium]
MNRSFALVPLSRRPTIFVALAILVASSFWLPTAQVRPAKAATADCHPVGARFVQLRVRHTGMALDIAGQSMERGARATQWPVNGQANQQWRLEDSGEGYVRIVARHSCKVLDVKGQSMERGAQVYQWDSNGQANQQWRIEDVGEGYVRIVARHSGMVLDVAGQSTEQGANVTQWPANGQANQQWRIEDVVDPVTYFAVGDSYSSGEGAGSYDNKTNIPQWQSRQSDPQSGDMCHRSANAYPQVLVRRKPDLRLSFSACSGAEVRHLRDTEQYDGVQGICQRGACRPGKQTGGDTPGGQISTFAASGANLVTVTIGGNDVGFAAVLQHCIQVAHCEQDEEASRTVGRIDSAYSSLYDVYRQIRDSAVNGRILVLGYPQIFQTNVDCGGTFGLQPEERAWLIERFSQMDDVIERAVGAANAANDKSVRAVIEYLDMEDAFHGHELCMNDSDGTSYVNGVDTGIPEAFHPNAKGHTVLAGYIFDHLVNSTPVDPCPEC